MRINFLSKRLLIILFFIYAFCSHLFPANSDIRLNSVGYLPNNQKKASIIIACTTFNVIRVPAGTTAFTGNVTGPVTDADSGQSIRTADFSSLSETGTFYLQVPGVGQSYEFEIKPDLYNSQYYTAMRGMYLWRASIAVSGTHNSINYSHPGGHFADGNEYYSRSPFTNVYKDGDGGWYDAGDYGRYTVNAGITMGFFFKAWDEFKPFILATELNIPESAGALPDYLAELKYETNWLFKMQYWDGSGKVHHKLTTMGHAGWVMPQNDTNQLYFTETSSAATADFVAIMAMAYRAFLPYDAAYANQCLNAASLSYNYLRANTANDPATDYTTTGGYGTTDSDDRLWAAVEFWEATGNTAAHADLVTRFGGFTNKVRASLTTGTVFGWSDVESLASIAYLASTRTGKDAAIITDIQNDIVAAANSIVTTRNGHGYGRTMGATYFWGCNGHMGNQVMLLLAANKLSPNANYIETSLDTLNYLYGRNYYNRSFITGLGDDPPMNPHDRRSAADGIAAPWPGYLVGGSSTNVTGWNDLAANLTTNYSYNEIAINWQAPLVYSLAAFSSIVGTPTFTPTFTRTQVITPTFTRTGTPTFTRTLSPSLTRTNTYTNTPVNTSTFTSTRTNANTPANTFTNTPVNTPTFTVTRTSTNTPLNTMTFTRTVTLTPVKTFTNTPFNTATFTRTVAETQTPINTSTFTRTASPSASATSSSSASVSPTSTATRTGTYTRTSTRTPTFTRTITSTFTVTETNSVSPTITETWTGTPPTPSFTPTVTRTWTSSATDTVTRTDTATPTDTPVNTETATPTRTRTFTNTPINTPTNTAVNTASNTPVNTPTNTPVNTLTNTPVNTLTNTPVNTSTNTPVNTSTNTPLNTATRTLTLTLTLTAVPTSTSTSTSTFTPVITATPSLFEIKNSFFYPHPYNPSAGGGAHFSCGLTQDAKYIKIRLYTAAFRVVKEIKIEGPASAGRVDAAVQARDLSRLAAGTYYYTVTAVSVNGQKAKAGPGALIIIR